MMRRAARWYLCKFLASSWLVKIVMIIVLALALIIGIPAALDLGRQLYTLLIQVVVAWAFVLFGLKLFLPKIGDLLLNATQQGVHALLLSFLKLFGYQPKAKKKPKEKEDD